MPSGTPESIRRLCRELLPDLERRTNGGRMLERVRVIQNTDRCTSFDQYLKTADALAHMYESVGADADRHSAQTGGAAGSGRWIIAEATDVRSATVDVIEPVRRRVLDYHENPWHVVQWSHATPPQGLTGGLYVVDTPSELDRIPKNGLTGKIMLTRMNPRNIFARIVEKRPLAVMSDMPVPNFPNAVNWQKFGWGRIPMSAGGAQLVGFALSERQGDRLRKVLSRTGGMKLRVRADIRRYTGQHEVVSGVIRGRDDPQDEVWALAHAYEPGALDNASGVACCVEIAQVLEELIREGAIERPRRSIRLVSGYECYGFFHHVEHRVRYQPPLAGVNLDAVGARPDVCRGRLWWHATIPMSAGFVDRVGVSILRAALRLDNPGYRLRTGPFLSTQDTLIGDPKYGFPCPWLGTSIDSPRQKYYDAYHSSADTPSLLSRRGLSVCAAAMGAYLYYLADAASDEVMQLATMETDAQLQRFKGLRGAAGAEQAAYIREQHHASIERLQRWMWGGDRSRVLRHISDCEQSVADTCRQIEKRGSYRRKPRSASARRIPRRTAPISPTLENTSEPVASRIRESGLEPWALFWADSRRTLADIARLLSSEYGRAVQVADVELFFEAHAELEYCELIDADDCISKRELVEDLRLLGLQPGMDVIVHSSMSAIGHVSGGADTVVDALLAAIGKRGTLMMPTFTHGSAKVFNPMVSPSTNGAIPNAFWRRADVQRTQEPTHAVAAIGPKAENYCAGHSHNGAFGFDSPIARLMRDGGSALMLGVNYEYCTTYHVGEINIPCGCIDMFGNDYRVVDREGRVVRTRGLAYRSEQCPVPHESLNEAIARAGLERRGMVGKAPARLTRAINVFNMRKRLLKNSCSNCRIKPRYLERG